MIEWNAVRISARGLPPEHAVADWEHREISFVEQKGAEAMPKDRCVEQGDVDMVAAEARQHVAVQSPGHVPWFGTHTEDHVQMLRVEHRNRMHRMPHFQLGGPEKLAGTGDQRHGLQESEGLADFWYLHDGDI